MNRQASEVKEAQVKQVEHEVVKSNEPSVDREPSQENRPTVVSRETTPKTSAEIEVIGKMEYDDDDDFEATQSSVTTPHASSPGTSKVLPSALNNDDDEFEASQTP